MLAPRESSPSTMPGLPSWYRKPIDEPYRRSDRIASRSFASRSSVCSAPSWPHHWNGVCGLGTKPPIDTVQRMSRRPLTRRPVSITFLASSAIWRTSSSVSVGSPHMK
jgi:hypothetical protein